MGVSGGPDIVQDGLIFEVDASDINSYPRTGTTWFDLSGNRNNGTLTNGPTFNGANGGYFSFDGTNDYVEVLNNSIINPTTAITLNCWFYANSFKTISAIAVRNITSGTTGFDFYLSNNLVFCIIRTTVSNNFSYFSNTTLNTSTWYNVTLTYTSGDARMYINSNLDNSTVSQTGNLQYTFPEPLRIGQDWNTARALDGRISVVQLYNRVLSASEILQNYNATRTRFGL